MAPPPKELKKPRTELPENVLVVMVSVPSLLLIAPPYSLPELPENVLLLMVSVPLLRIAPPDPLVAELPENVLLLTVSVPLLEIAPLIPLFPPDDPLLKVRPLTVSLTPALTERIPLLLPPSKVILSGEPLASMVTSLLMV